MNQPILSFTAEQIYHYPFHHKPELRLLYVLQGALEIKNVSGSIKLYDDDIEFVNIEEPAEILSLSENNLVLVMEIDTSFLKTIHPNVDKLILNVGASQFFKSEERHTTKQNIRNTARLKDMMLGLLDEYTRNRYSLSIEKNLQVFSKFIIEHFDDIKKLVSCFPHGNDRMVERFQRIDLYMQNHLSERIKLDYLVENEYLTTQYLSSEIKSKYNRTFSSILEYYRITAAARLILTCDENISVSEIINRCGFSDDKYFYRAFKNHLGCTPSVFRKRAKEQGSPIVRYLDLQSDDFLKMRFELIKNEDKSLVEEGSFKKQMEGYYTGQIREAGFLKGHASRITSELTEELMLKQDEVWFCHQGEKVVLLVQEPVKGHYSRIVFSADFNDLDAVSNVYLKKGSRVQVFFGDDGSSGRESRTGSEGSIFISQMQINKNH